ncbi:MAG: TonB-dependent receptor [Chromatiales bacterium]|nr:TonB-dependent receptor [Chromatiales bacterium]
MNFLPLFLMWLVAAVIPVPALADGALLEPVVVTATRTAVTRDRVLAPVTIIDRDELDRSSASDIAELLRFHGGIEVARTGGPGQATSVFIRGAESNHTLVLLDGVKLNSGTSGIAAIQDISPDLIERIEVVKGPRSSLYGSEAVGGVINVITRRDGAPLSAGAEAGAGRYDTMRAAGRIGWSGEDIAAGANVSWYDTDGFPTLEASDDDAGYDNLSVDLWSRASVGSVDLDAGYWRAAGTTEYSDFFLAPVQQDYTNHVTRVGIGVTPLQNWSSKLTLSRAVDDIEQGQGAFNPSDFTKTDRIAADWQNTIDGPAGIQLVAGANLSREETSGLIFGSRLEDSPGSGDVKIDVNAAYAEATYARGRQQFLAAARYTDHDIFGSQESWNAEYGFDIVDGLRLSAGAGRAFRAPTSLELYGFGGNPQLEPEISRNIEASISGEFGSRHRYALTAFRNQIDDLIEFVFTDPENFVGENRNVEEAEIEGVELSYAYQGQSWRLRSEITLQDPKNKSDDERLLRRARQMFTLSLVRRIGEHDVGLDVLATDDREDFGGARLAGYVLANLTSRFRIGEHWQIKANVENILDTDYQLADGYRSAGRGLYASLAYSY